MMLALGLAIAFAPVPALAAKAIALTEKQQAAIGDIDSFLESFKHLQGEFTQISPKGNVSKGVFFLRKPGKMRFEYAAPNPFLIVSDGSWVTIKNRAKDRADEYPLSQTPLRLVLSDEVDLLDETKILDFQEEGGIVTVTLEDRKRHVPGSLVLVFDSNSRMLQQWIVVDGQGRRTTVSLENIEMGVVADPKLFTIKVTRRGGRRKSDQ